MIVKKGMISGKVRYLNRFHPLAPSRFPASYNKFLVLDIQIKILDCLEPVRISLENML